MKDSWFTSKYATYCMYTEIEIADQIIIFTHCITNTSSSDCLKSNWFLTVANFS